MSEGIIIALITAIGSLLGGIIGQIIVASATVRAAHIKANPNQTSDINSDKSLSLSGILGGALIGAVLTLGALAIFGVLNFGKSNSPVSPTTVIFTPTAVILPTEVVQVAEIITPDAPLYDDFESNTIDSNKWGLPIWDNPQQYTPIQSQGALRFEIRKDWFDWAVKQPQNIEEMYALVTLDSVNDGALGISLKTVSLPESGYILVLKKDHVSVWNGKDTSELNFPVSGTCCPYTHLLGATADGKRLYFYVDNKLIGTYPFDGYPDYATLQIAGASRIVASVSDVWIKFRP